MVRDVELLLQIDFHRRALNSLEEAAGSAEQAALNQGLPRQRV